MNLILAYRSFVRLAERGSFSAVARETGESQPTVSRRLSELEDYLGTRLVNRTTRALALTAEGRELLDKARAVLRAADAAEQAVGARARSLSGQLTLAAPVSFGRIVLVPRIAEFMARHREITIDLVLSDDPLESLPSGVDLALATGVPHLRGEQLRKLGDAPLVLCGAPALIGAAGTPRTVEALEALPAVVLTGPGDAGNLWRLERGAEIREVVPAARLRSNSVEAVLAALVAGLGIGLVPQWLAQQAIDSQQLWRLLPQWRGGAVPIHLAVPAGRASNARARALADFLAETLRGERLTG
ncbi:MAG: LysR family transcriptional regulator [Erythrobacter sp.]